LAAFLPLPLVEELVPLLQAERAFQLKRYRFRQCHLSSRRCRNQNRLDCE
jgi:hypothetical protein